MKGRVQDAVRVMGEFYCGKGVAAWELYPGFKPGFRLDERGGVAEQIIRKGIELGLGFGAITTVSPDAQIGAFRSLTIPESMQAAYGYPALTDEIKAKIFGLNAARLHGIDPAAMRCRPNVC